MMVTASYLTIIHATENRSFAFVRGGKSLSALASLSRLVCRRSHENFSPPAERDKNPSRCVSFHCDRILVTTHSAHKAIDCVE